MEILDGNEATIESLSEIAWASQESFDMMIACKNTACLQTRRRITNENPSLRLRHLLAYSKSSAMLGAKNKSTQLFIYQRSRNVNFKSYS